MLNGKPVICITSDDNQKSSGGVGPRSLISPKAYSAAIAAAGGVPVLAPEFCARELHDLSDGLLLSGGDDINPALFGEAVLNDTVNLDPIREEYEIELAKLFLASGKPILTTCRGFQLLSCILGGSLYQDIPAQLGLEHMGREIRHPVKAYEGTTLFHLFGARFKTNSTHHQAIREPGKGLVITARAEDGVIEGYEHESRPILGTQFHPERLTGVQWDDRTPDFAPLYKHFIDMVVNHAR